MPYHGDELRIRRIDTAEGPGQCPLVAFFSVVSPMLVVDIHEEVQLIQIVLRR